MNMKNVLDRKMRILYLHAGAEMYGADKVLLELIKGLDKSKFEPFVILPSDGPLVKKLRENGVNVDIIEYPILRRRIFNPKGLIKYLKDYLFYSKKLSIFAEKNLIDLIHVNTTAVLEGIYIKKKNKLPLLWHIHEIITSPKLVYMITSFFIGKFSDKIVTVSNAVKDHLVNSGFVNTNKIEVIYNGIDGKLFEDNDVDKLKDDLNIPENSTIVGMIGRINSWKGQKDFLVALDRLLDTYDNLFALMIGGVFEGEEWRKKDLEEKIVKMNSKNKIILLDFQEDIYRFHSLIDVFVLPSTSPDPLPTVVLESMASSKPIVGYSHGGILEMVYDSENMLVEPRNTSELAKKIELLINDPNLLYSVGIENKKRQNRMFDKSIYSKSFEKVYEYLIEGISIEMDEFE